MNLNSKICQLFVGLAALCAADLPAAATNESMRVVSADLRQSSSPLNTMFKRCVALETRTVKINRDGKFEQKFEIRENDAVLITLNPQH